MSDSPFKTEAALCSAFMAWAGRYGAKCFAEWAGWDILLVYPDGLQLGIQAKLRLNAEVLGQAVPSIYGRECEDAGPDFRAVLVPAANPLSGIAAQLGLVVFRPSSWDDRFAPDLFEYRDKTNLWGNAPLWLDWNPRRHHELPPAATDAVAGSPCPVTLTHWKLAALDVLAELAVKGSITTKRVRELGLNPSRWLSGFWLVPGEKRGDWIRGDRCPGFDEQHPTAYALALEKARSAAA